MLQKNNRYNVLNVFFEQPTNKLQLREISRLAKLAPLSTTNYLKEFIKEGTINKTKKGIYPTYQANRENETFKRLKRINTIWKLYQTGLIDHIASECSPDAITLFGSANRGEDTETSDIDLYIISEENPLKLKQYETKLKRKINPLFNKTFKELNPELKNNILNGTILQGYIKVF